MQVDWTTMRSGKNPIYGFVATLGYSRYTFTCFTDNMEASTLIACHEKAFLFFGGVTRTILYDKIEPNDLGTLRPDKPKELPQTVVQKPNLAQYDLLLPGVAA